CPGMRTPRPAGPAGRPARTRRRTRAVGPRPAVAPGRGGGAGCRAPASARRDRRPARPSCLSPGPALSRRARSGGGPEPDPVPLRSRLPEVVGRDRLEHRLGPDAAHADRVEAAARLEVVVREAGAAVEVAV